MEVIITSPVQRQINQIYEFYSEEGYPGYAQKIDRLLIERSLELKNFPRRGQEEESLSHFGEGYRYIIVERYFKVIYKIVGDVVYISYIFNTRQDPEKIAERHSS